MAWTNQRQLFSDVPRSVGYRILRAGLDSSKIADILSCSSLEDLINLSWLPEKPFSQLAGELPAMETAIAFKTWNPNGVVSTEPYNEGNNFTRFSTGVKNGDKYGDTVLKGTATASVSDAERWGWSLEDTNLNACSIYTASDIGNNHSFIFFSNLGINPRLKKIDSAGTISVVNNNFTYSSEVTGTPYLLNEELHDGNRTHATFNPTVNLMLGGTQISNYNYGIHDGFYHNSFTGYVFENSADLDYYLRTGDSSKAINGEGEKPEGEEALKFMYCTTFRNNSPTKNTSDVVSIHDIELTYNKGIEGYGGTRPCAGYITPTTPYNIKIKLNPASDITKCEIDLHGTSTEGKHEADFETIDNPNWTYEELVQSEGTPYYYFGQLRTNIPIFETEQQVNEYFAGRLSASNSLNGGGNYHGKPTDIGNKKNESLFNNLYAPTILSKTLICSFACLTEIAGILFPPEIATLKELTDAMLLFGENPISFISDFYMIPFDPRIFCQTQANNQMSFGSYYKLLSSGFEEVVSSNLMPTMCSTYIDGTFNDFRDYMANYYLVLPYVGIVNISVDQYLYHTLTIKALFDARTGNIRYFLLCDNVLVDQYEGSARVSLPLVGSDAYTSALTKVGGAVSVAQGIGSLNMSYAQGMLNAVSSQGGMDSVNNVIGTATAGFGAVGKISEGARELTKASPKSTTGGFSSGTGFADQLDFYLIIEQQEIDYPPELISQYGLPDNDVSTIGNYRGYIECDNVKLIGDATAGEKTEILNILRGGVII